MSHHEWGAELRWPSGRVCVNTRPTYALAQADATQPTAGLNPVPTGRVFRREVGDWVLNDDAVDVGLAGEGTVRLEDPFGGARDDDGYFNTQLFTERTK
jgi:hypothetical protein